MPKLRDRKALEAAKLKQKEDVAADRDHWRCWSQREGEALLEAVLRHGTFSQEPLDAAVPDRDSFMLSQRLTSVRRTMDAESRRLAVDLWLDRLAHALPTRPGASGERTDVSAATLALLLAAEEERRQAEQHGREDLSDVYTYLAHLANGKVPPRPEPATSRRLLALLHHLAALMKTIDLSRHNRWLWCNQRLRKLGTEHLGLTEEAAPPECADLRPVPADLRPAMAALAPPSSNVLHVPPALLLSPLASQLNERRAGDTHRLLGQPPAALLAEDDARWDEPDGTRVNGLGVYISVPEGEQPVRRFTQAGTGQARARARPAAAGGAADNTAARPAAGSSPESLRASQATEPPQASQATRTAGSGGAVENGAENGQNGAVDGAERDPMQLEGGDQSARAQGGSGAAQATPAAAVAMPSGGFGVHPWPRVHPCGKFVFTAAELKSRMAAAQAGGAQVREGTETPQPAAAAAAAEGVHPAPEEEAECSAPQLRTYSRKRKRPEAPQWPPTQHLIIDMTPPEEETHVMVTRRDEAPPARDGGEIDQQGEEGTVGSGGAVLGGRSVVGGSRQRRQANGRQHETGPVAEPGLMFIDVADDSERDAIDLPGPRAPEPSGGVAPSAPPTRSRSRSRSSAAASPSAEENDWESEDLMRRPPPLVFNRGTPVMRTYSRKRQLI